MLKATKWKPEKIKIKAVFRLQFHASHIPRVGWDKLYVSLVATESGKVTAGTKKANVRNGSCKWADPIYETTRLLQDSKTKKCDDKIYKLVVAMGMSRSGVLGEAEINIAEFYEASKPTDIALPLQECGSVLHVTLQLLTSKTGFREFEQQNQLREMSLGKSSSSSSDEPFTVHTLKENAEVEEYSESKIRSNGSNSSPQSLHPEHTVSTPKNTTDEAESSLFDIEGVVNSLEISVNNIENTAHIFEQNLALESTSRKLLSEQDLKFLEISEQMPRFSSLSSVEDGLRDLHKKALFAEDGMGASFCQDIGAVLETLQNFKLGFEKDQVILESRIHDLERELENFVQETGEIQRKIAVESKSLRHEYSTCIYTVSSAKSEVEDTNRRLLGLLAEREELVSTNGELERRAVRSENTLQKVRQRYSVSVGRLQSDLELLSSQVSSVFENGGGLMEESSCLNQKVGEPDTGEEISEEISRDNPFLGEKIENLEQEVLWLKEENKSLRIRSDSEIHEVVEEKARIFLEVGRLRSQIERLEGESLKLKEENRSLRIRSDSEIKEATDEKDRLFLEVGRLGSQIELLEEENRSLRRKYDFEIHEAGEEKAQFFLEVGRLGFEIERLEEENLQLKEENRSLRTRSDSEIYEVGEEKARLFLEVGLLSSRIELLDEENIRLKEDNRSLRIRLDSEILEAGEKKVRFILEVSDLCFQIERLHEESFQLEEESRTLRIRSDSEKDRFILEIGRLGSEIEKLRFEKGDFFEKISILRAAYKELEETVEVKTKEATAGAVILDILTEKMRLQGSRIENLLLYLENENQKIEDLVGRNVFLEVRDTILEAELKAQISYLSVKFSEQILEVEESRKIAARKDPTATVNETLRMALMKEEYEGRIEDLEQRLLDSRKHGGDILLKLQEAAEEVERRKKAEASESRKNEELKAMLEAETSRRRLEIFENEKTILETFLTRLRGATEGDVRDTSVRTRYGQSVGGNESVEQKVENEFGEVLCFKATIDRLHSQLEMLIRENRATVLVPTVVLEENEEVGPTQSGSRDVNERVDALENDSTNNYSRSEKGEEGGVIIEKELAEMQQRYSNLSLMFAQVEAERQRLVLILKTLRPLPP